MFDTFTTAAKIFGLLADLAFKKETKKHQSRDSIGFSFGPTHGAGASYRKSIFNGKIGIQGTMSPPIFSHDNLFWAAGTTFFYDFADISSWARPYISFGVGGGFHRQKNTHLVCPEHPDYDLEEKEGSEIVTQHAYPSIKPGLPVENVEPEIVECYQREHDDTKFIVGIGPALGIEMRIQKLLTFNIEMPLAFSWTESGFQIMPIPNVSIRADM